jgi:hypothetical protein
MDKKLLLRPMQNAWTLSSILRKVAVNINDWRIKAVYHCTSVAISPNLEQGIQQESQQKENPFLLKPISSEY